MSQPVTDQQRSSHPNIEDLWAHRRFKKSQEQIADECGVRQPTVSDWVHGVKKPEPAHAALLARSAGIDPVKLAERLSLDVERVLNVYGIITSPDEGLALEFAKETLEEIPAVRTQGNPRAALHQAELVVRLLDKTLTRTFLGRRQDALLDALAVGLYDQAFSVREFLPHLEVPTVTVPLAERLRDIAETTGKENHQALAIMAMAHAHYIAGMYDAAEEEFRQLRGLPTTRNERLLNLRTHDIVVALMRGLSPEERTRQVERLEVETRRLIDAGRYDTLQAACTAIEGMARARGMIDLDRGLRLFEEAEQTYGQLIRVEQGPLQPLQVEIGRLEVMARWNALGRDELTWRVRMVQQRAIVAGYEKYAIRAGWILGERGYSATSLSHQSAGFR